ncbi:hypothetical protein F511_29304 [Dorcoceras hygrometricum]|uniref:Dystroglycan-like n=1 Tax=Dorcoceras hygrometricum TaxID=472368 RepID=A0A2Z7CX32_9LAMI|nr:hypothetical protein F511_29304 [Dorcoceras hygrometricum]
MVKEYRKLSHTFEEVKSENDDLINSSVEPSIVELGEADSLKIELSKLKAENELLRSKSCELESESEKLNLTMSSWTKSSASLDKMFGIQKPSSDRTGLGFIISESSSGETSTQSQLVYDKFNKMSFVKASVTYDSFESMTYNDQTSQKWNHKGKTGIGYQRPENSKPSWLKNKLDKDKSKAGSKSFAPNQPRRNSTKVKSSWRKVQLRRDLNGQNMKSTLNRSHHGFAQTLTDSSTGKTVKISPGVPAVGGGATNLQPDVAQPAVAPTDAVQPDVAQPAVAPTDAVQPDVAQPAVAPTDAVQPDVAQPAVAPTDAVQPDVAQPAVAPTDAVQPDGAQADVAQTDLATQRPTSEAPVASTYQLVSKPTADERDTITHQLAYSKFIYQSAMASSLYVNTVHVFFEVLAMDNAGMVVMFESLVATGLKGFLGCPTVIHEAALTAVCRDFELPVEGLSNLSEIPKDIVFDARSIVSLSGEPVSTSGKKREMTIEFRLLCDILAKTISVKVGSFDAITQEKFLMMAAITCGVRINWNRLLFNILKDMVTSGSRQAKGYAIQISLLLENVPNLELGESSEFPCQASCSHQR